MKDVTYVYRNINVKNTRESRELIEIYVDIIKQV